LDGPAEDPGAAWMVAWQQGDEEAFERLVHAYSGRVHTLLTRFLGPVPQREDLVQDVFLRVVRARDGYRPTARFTTWLYRIVFNLAANEREKLRLRRSVSLDEERDGRDARGAPPVPRADPRGESAPERLARGDTVRAVRAAIAALPENQRQALILAKYEELPYAEIGLVLGASEKAVKSLVHRARENLRVQLARELDEEVA
jgi:RNA polymerase sigma-70 factor (ECF subfamily)